MTYHSHVINPQGPRTVNKEKEIIIYISLSCYFVNIKAMIFVVNESYTKETLVLEKIYIYDIEG